MEAVKDKSWSPFNYWVSSDMFPSPFIYGSRYVKHVTILPIRNHNNNNHNHFHFSSIGKPKPSQKHFWFSLYPGYSPLYCAVCACRGLYGWDSAVYESVITVHVVQLVFMCMWRCVHEQLAEHLPFHYWSVCMDPSRWHSSDSQTPIRDDKVNKR